MENAIFSWREIARCFWATAFFLAGKRKTIVAFEKEVSLKSLSLFSKTIVRQYCSFKFEEKKHLISINAKKKFKGILVKGENFKLRKLPSKDFIALFSSRRRACLVLKHNRVSEVFKGFKVHDFVWRPVLVKIVVIKLPHKSVFSVTVLLFMNLLCIFIGGTNFFF